MIENTYKEFDYYQTDLDFVDSNNDEKYLKISSYGLKKEDICKYKEKIRKTREEYKEKHIRICHWNTIFLWIISILTVLLFLEFIGYYNDFMKKIGLFYDIILTPSYFLFIWLFYKYVFGIGEFLLETVLEKYENGIMYPIDGHPECFNGAIEKYFNDLLWCLYVKKAQNHNK